MSASFINSIVAMQFGLKTAELHTRCNAERFTIPRMSAMMICRSELGFSYPRLCRVFGKKSHTTTRYAVVTGQSLYNSDPDFKKKHDRALAQVRKLMPTLKVKKQRYNLHYRLREKGINVKTKDHSVGITNSQETIISNDLQLIHLLTKHNYIIQYQMF
jgi:hypothetical protein